MPARIVLVLLLLAAPAHAQTAGGAGHDARDIQAATAPVNAAALLNELVALVDRVHAYADLRGLDLQSEAARELARLGDRPGRQTTLLALQRFVARLGDGHAEVDGWLDAAPSGCLPFLLAEAEGGVVAFKGDRSGFLDERHPFVDAIDSRPIEDWISAASAYIPAGSSQLVRRRSIELLRYAALVRAELSLPDGPGEIALRSTDGRSSTRLSFRLQDRGALYGAWPRRESGVLPSGFGYLRIERMSLEDGGPGETPLRGPLEAAFTAPALIIDVRGNSGGARDPIPLLMSRLLNPGESRVISVAAKRLPDRAGPAPVDGYLQDRGMYPALWSKWSPAERTAIAAAAAAWKPAWTPDRPWAEAFSDWHYFVVSGEPNPYPGPVVVLMDDGCFSATDILLGGLKGLANVTLLGTASAGGSANTDRYTLKSIEPEIRVRLGTMASFRPDGRLYDGSGIEPDAVVPRRATDLIGRTDTQLEAAETALRDKLAGRR